MHIEWIADHGNADDMIVDLFAGGGGASTGMEMALRRPVSIALNHCREAIEVHTVNHPLTKHYQEDVWKVSPREAVGSRRVKWLWASSSCTHHSRAKGGVPLDKKIRGLSWAVVRWARETKPDFILGENVFELTSWSPLLPNGRPDPERKGQTFREWVAAIVDLGYSFDWKMLRAADYGVPTTRDRLFYCARRDKKPVVWPLPTHGKGRPLPWIPASSFLDFSLPSKSIFGRPKPLVDATFRRVAAGIQKFVLNTTDPVVVTNDGAMTLPFITKHYGGPNGNQTPGSSVSAPVGTITAIDHHALTQVDVVDLDDPEVGENEEYVKHFVAKYFGQGSGAVSIDEPMHTATSHDRFALVSVYGKAKRIRDVRMRMFTPKELFAGMGFPQSYAFDRDTKGKPIPRGKQVMLAGNAVCPPLAEALVRAQMSA